MECSDEAVRSSAGRTRSRAHLGDDPVRVVLVGLVTVAAVGGGPDPTEPKPVLRARVARCVDGLDLLVYHKALETRNKFLHPPSKQQR